MNAKNYRLKISIHNNLAYIKFSSESPAKIIASVKAMIVSGQIDLLQDKDICISCAYPAQASAFTYVATPHIVSLAVNGVKVFPASDDSSQIEAEAMPNSNDANGGIAQEDIRNLLVGERF